MQEEVIQDLHNKVQNLAAALETNSGALEQLKIIQQRRHEEVREVRLESKSYGAEILKQIENMQDQINDRFEGVHTRIDSLTEAVNDLVGLLRNALTAAGELTEDENPDNE